MPLLPIRWSHQEWLSWSLACPAPSKLSPVSRHPCTVCTCNKVQLCLGQCGHAVAGVANCDVGMWPPAAPAPVMLCQLTVPGLETSLRRTIQPCSWPVWAGCVANRPMVGLMSRQWPDTGLVCWMQSHIAAHCTRQLGSELAS